MPSGGFTSDSGISTLATSGSSSGNVSGENRANRSTVEGGRAAGVHQTDAAAPQLSADSFGTSGGSSSVTAGVSAPPRTDTVTSAVGQSLKPASGQLPSTSRPTTGGAAMASAAGLATKPASGRLPPTFRPATGGVPGGVDVIGSSAGLPAPTAGINKRGAKLRAVSLGASPLLPPVGSGGTAGSIGSSGGASANVPQAALQACLQLSAGTPGESVSINVR